MSKVMQAIGFVVAGVLLLTGVCAAQVSTSTINGTVTDQNGLLVVGAKVVARNEGTGVAYETTTTSAGAYTISSVPPGQYTITITQPGFRTFTSLHNVLTVGAPLVVDGTLKIGEVSEVVEVEATYARVETSNAMVSDVVNRRAVAELPLNGRNPLNLIVLQPGLTQRTTSATGSGTHVFGSRDRAHNVTIDGIDANESSVPNPQTNVFRLTSDNVQEYRVVTHNATPEFGRNSGANVNIATRGGTNEYHGDVYWYHRNTALNANEWFNNASGQSRPALLLHQYGFDIGGPIIKNRTFFFGSWQNNHISQTQPISAAFASVPAVYTDTLKNTGVFRYFVPDANNPVVINGKTITRNDPLLVDPNTGALKVPLCGGSLTMRCVQTYNIFANDPMGIGADPLMKAMFATFPSPNTFRAGANGASNPADGLNTAGFQWNPASQFTGPFYLSRVDHKFNDNNNLSGTFIWTQYDTTQGDFLNSRPAVFPGFPPLGEVSRTSTLLSVAYRRTFSPNLVNELTGGFSRFKFFFSLIEANARNGVVPPPYGQQCFGGSSLRTVSSPFCNTPHTERAVSNLQLIDNLSYIRSAHTLRFGTNIRTYRHNDERGAPGGFNMSPTIVFDQSNRGAVGFTLPTVISPTNLTGIDPTDRQNLENSILELVGIPSRVQQAFVGDPATNQYVAQLSRDGLRAKQFDLYAQDEWKVRRNVTLNFGVRWEYNRPASECCGRLFVPDRRVDGSAGPVTFVPASGWWSRNNANAFAPRVGLAWDVRGNAKTVVRAGYGIAFDTLSTFQATAVAGKVPGISAFQCRLTVGNAPPAGCPSVPNLRVAGLIAALNPFTLSQPTARPLANTAPPNDALGTAPDVGTFDPNLQMPTVHEWSLTVQRELPWNIVAQVGYIGKRGTHLFRAYDLNQTRSDQPGLLNDFMIAQRNVASGCNADGTGCPTGVPPTLLLALTSASFMNNSTVKGFLQQNALGDLVTRIDTQAFSTFANKPQFGPNFFRPNPQFSQIFFFDSGGDSYYHGMIVQLRRRFEKGLDLGFSYSLAKSMDDMSVDPVGATSGGALSITNSRTPTDVHNFRLDRGRSDFDNRHVIVMNALYELPFGKGRKWGSNWSGLVNQVLGGWSTTGIYIFQSGEPFSLNSGLRTVHNTHQSRPDLQGPLPDFGLDFVPGIQGPVYILASGLVNNCRQVVGTESSFCIPAPGQSGMGRNTIQGPSFWNMDMGILKNFSVTERLRLQFRTELFNVFNHANFESPRNASNGSPTLTNTLFGLTCCATASVPSSSTIIATGEPNRVIQFALKVQF